MITSIVRRRGQPEFRNGLMKAYGGRCAITGCDAEEALEAAHIVPYRGEHTNHPTNGLLLRADIHTLFDRGLIGIDPTTMRVVVAERLRGTVYGTFHEEDVKLPDAEDVRPSQEALLRHMEEAGLAA